MDTLRYNIRWVKQTFPDRPTAEVLLAPHRDLLHPADYDAALRFLPDHRNHYLLLGALVPLPLLYAFRRPSWSVRRLCLTVGAVSLAGSFSGHAFFISRHVAFVRSIQDPAAFAVALESIRKDSGLPVPAGPLIIRKSGKLSVATESEPYGNDTPAPAPDAPPPAPTKFSSRWDQIRAANAPAASPSSWDALRQKHERQRVTPSPIQPELYNNNDRAAEQAEFDTLLERERNIQ